MKIAIPNFPSADSFVDNVADALRRLGHDVVAPKRAFASARHPALRALRDFRHKAFPRHWEAHERWAVTTARSHKPDLLLCLTLSIRQEVLDELRRLGVGRLVAWWGDTPANMRGMGLLATGWDVVFIKDQAAVQKFRAVGIQSELLHEAMNPAWHKRCFERVGEDVVVAGSYYGYRQYLVECLMRRGAPMALYGPRPPRWAGSEITRAHRGRYIVREAKSRVFGEALACLNSTSLSEGNSLNCRAFEIAGACGLQLIEDKPAVASCFEPGKEVLTYRSVDEIMAHLKKAHREPAWAMVVREAGHRRAHAHHTYDQRLTYMLERIGMGGRRAATSTGAPSAATRDLAAE